MSDSARKEYEKMRQKTRQILWEPKTGKYTILIFLPIARCGSHLQEIHVGYAIQSTQTLY